MIYETMIEFPFDDGLIQFAVEKIRERAYPRLHIQIEADSRRDLALIVGELATELESRDCPSLCIEEFSRGRVTA